MNKLTSEGSNLSVANSIKGQTVQSSIKANYQINGNKQGDKKNVQIQSMDQNISQLPCDRINYSDMVSGRSTNSAIQLVRNITNGKYQQFQQQILPFKSFIQKPQLIQMKKPGLFSKSTAYNAALGTSIGAGTVGLVNVVSGVVISKLGWTAAGVASKTTAAIIHAKIGNAILGSWFAYLQSVGALGTGILGPVLVPAIIIGGAVGGGGVIVYKYRGQIGSALGSFKAKLTKTQKVV